MFRTVDRAAARRGRRVRATRSVASSRAATRSSPSLGDPGRPHDVLVQHPDTSRRDRAHRQLLVARDAELADYEHVERSLERARDLGRDRHPATRQAEHHHVRPARVAL